MGADYKKAQKSMILGSSYGNLPANTTNYASLGGPRLRANEVDARQVIPFSCTLTNFSVRASQAPGGADTITYTVMLNGAPTALLLVITGAAILAGPDLSIVPITAGDEVSLELVSSATAAVAFHNWSIELDR